MVPSKFQSTRLSRASTCLHSLVKYTTMDFNPQGSREPRPLVQGRPIGHGRISIHKALASLDVNAIVLFPTLEISIHKALASLDALGSGVLRGEELFQSTRLSRASTRYFPVSPVRYLFQSTRLSRASTLGKGGVTASFSISIHKALASLDSIILQNCS